MKNYYFSLFPKNFPESPLQSTFRELQDNLQILVTSTKAFKQQPHEIIPQKAFHNAVVSCLLVVNRMWITYEDMNEELISQKMNESIQGKNLFL